MSKNEEDLLDQTFSRLKEKGILNYFQARYISSVAQAVEKSDINCLKPYKNIYDSVADEIASQIIVQYLHRKNLKLTINTANYEYPNFLEIRNLSILSSLKISNEDLSSHKADSLHCLFKCWNETKDATVKTNKLAMRQEIQAKLDYIDKIDTQKQIFKNKNASNKKNEIEKNHQKSELHFNEKSFHQTEDYFNDNENNQGQEFISISKLGFNSQPVFFEDDDDFDTQIESQLLSLSSKSPNNHNINTKKKQEDDDIEIISTINENLSNINIQKRTASQPIMTNSNPIKIESPKTKKKKREVVTLIPMRSADLKEMNDTKTSFITKVQTLEFLESTSSSDNFFDSDVAKHESIQFDIDLSDNDNNKKVTSSPKKEIKKEKITDFDSDDFDDI